jgi:hypothetical protein
VNLYAYQDVPFKDEQAFKEFMDLNYLDHNEIQDALLSQGIVVPMVPLGSENGLNEVWLDLHNQVHTGIDTALNLESVDFSFLDTNDESSFNDWLIAHFQQHLLYEQALGLM